MLSRLNRALIALIALTVLSSLAMATHFRYAHVTWVRTPGGALNEVDITVTMAWRANLFEGGQFNLGDGTTVCFNLPLGTGITGCNPIGGAPMTDLGTFIDASGEMYRIGQATYTHTYAGEGPFTISATRCCRISTLQNAADDNWRLATTVDLRGGNVGSPVSSIPVILQVPVNTLYSFALPIADPDGDPVTCIEASSATSGITSTAMIGANALTIDSTCLLEWDTTGGVVGNKYAFQASILENHPGGSSGVVVLDFILELVDPSAVPTCAGGGNFDVVPGQVFNEEFTGTDPDGDMLTLSVLGTIPAGAVFTPPIGTTMASPFVVNFDWTPAPGQVNQAFAMSVVFTDPQNQQAACSLGVAVPDAPIFADQICDSTVMATSTVNLSFDISASANTGIPGEFVTLTTGPLPAGATLTPAPPVVGQPATTTFSWTPSPAQLGDFTVTYTATDQLGQQTTCQITITVAECFLLIATHASGSQWSPGGLGYDFTLQLANVFETHAVTLTDMPSWDLGNLRKFLQPKYKYLPIRLRYPVSETFMQVVMYNPNVFPFNPEQSSQVLHYTKWSNGEVTSRQMGTRDGMSLWMQEYLENGERKVRFPFSIDGL